jgi:hypothetical protein
MNWEGFFNEKDRKPWISGYLHVEVKKLETKKCWFVHGDLKIGVYGKPRTAVVAVSGIRFLQDLDLWVYCSVAMFKLQRQLSPFNETSLKIEDLFPYSKNVKVSLY